MDPGAVHPPLADGRYLLSDVLGIGGMATVFRAFDVHLQTPRAVKVLHTEVPSRARERFLAEAKTLARLQHPRITRIHDWGRDGERDFIVMELMEESAAGVMARRGPLPPAMALQIALDVLQGLQFAHERGVIHRDIKPENILLTTEGAACLADFGVARVADHRLTRTGAQIGTWAYMSPEQRQDSKHVGAAADIYAMGLTLHQLLVGRQTPPAASVPAFLVDILRRATRSDPADRFVSAQEMAASLAIAAATCPPDAKPAPPARAPTIDAPLPLAPPVQAPPIQAPQRPALAEVRSFRLPLPDTVLPRETLPPNQGGLTSTDTPPDPSALDPSTVDRRVALALTLTAVLLVVVALASIYGGRP